MIIVLRLKTVILCRVPLNVKPATLAGNELVTTAQPSHARGRVPCYVVHTVECYVTSDHKSKDAPLRHADAKGERKYSSYSFLTSALHGRVSGQRHHPVVLSLEKAPDTHWMDLRAGLYAG
jgi:hypothetical protein